MSRLSAVSASVCAVLLSLSPLGVPASRADPAPASAEASKPAEPKAQTVGDP